MRLPDRGTWTPLIPLPARWAVVGVIPLVPLSYGADYLLHQHRHTRPGDAGQLNDSYTIVELAMPIQVWGVLCLTAGLLMGIGFHMRWPRPVIIGSWLSGGVLGSLSVGRFVGVADLPWWDGISGPVIVGAVAVACWGMAIGYTKQLAGGSLEGDDH